VTTTNQKPVASPNSNSARFAGHAQKLCSTQQQIAEPLLTEKQAAAYLNMAVKTLQNWRWRGVGPRYVKIGDLVRYRKADLDEFVLSNLRTSTSDVDGR
jgi:predicted DNA-binding transcriptional regulator AlpA